MVQNDEHVERRERHVARADHAAGCRSCRSAPIRIGVIAKKIMIVPCIVKSVV